MSYYSLKIEVLSAIEETFVSISIFLLENRKWSASKFVIACLLEICFI